MAKENPAVDPKSIELLREFAAQGFTELVLRNPTTGDVKTLSVTTAGIKTGGLEALTDAQVESAKQAFEELADEGEGQ